MKKSILLFTFALFAICGFSQTIKVSKDGKSAVECKAAIPAVETSVSKEALINKRDILEKAVADLEKQLAAAKAKLEEIKDVCDKLDYK